MIQKLVVEGLKNPLDASSLFLYTLYTSENKRSSDNVRGYRTKPVAGNRLR